MEKICFFHNSGENFLFIIFDIPSPRGKVSAKPTEEVDKTQSVLSNLLYFRFSLFKRKAEQKK